MKRGRGNPKTMTSTVHGIVAGLALPALAAVCPEALAHDRIGPMESKLRQMQQEMNAMQQELERLRAGEAAQDQSIQGIETQNTTQHQEITDRVTKVEEAPGKRTMKNFVFFRGGYTEYRDLARGFESFTDTHNTLGLGSGNVAEDGYYVGAAIEHSMTSDLWGLWQGTEALGEISLEYKHFKSEPQTLVVPTAECAILAVKVGLSVADCVVTGDVAKTMFTVSASPKIKFLEGSKLRPWIIPGGLDFHVISPPSDAATYLDVGIQFGAGAEYEILPGIKAGIDGRYHLIPDESSNSKNNISPVFAANGLALAGDTDKDLDFWTIGGYLGFNF